MSVTLMRRVSAIAFFVLSSTLAAQGQELNWAQKMFDTQEHDFGVVARGSDTRFYFKIKNLYKETIHFSGARTTCGCSAAKLSKDTLTSLEEGTLEIKIDTEHFSHEKSAAAVVTIDSPNYMEVRLPLKVYIRTDVLLTPGGVNFGSVDKGSPAVKTVSIAYAGRPDWKIQGVKTNNKNLTANVRELTRNGGSITYEMSVTLDANAPVGSVNDRITIETNDSNSPVVPVLVNGQVEADFTVTPGALSFGQMPAGESKTINVVVRGKAPFVIEKIECESDKQAFRFRPAEGEKRVHVVPLTFVAPAEPGKFSELFTVTIAGRKEPITFKANAEILAAAAKPVAP